MSAGNFSCSDLAQVHLKAEQIWADNASNKDYVANVGTAKAIMQEQTVQIAEFSSQQENPKDKTVKLIWVKDCDETSADCSDECTISGVELETACDTHALDICRNSAFQVDEKATRSNDINVQELVAKGMLKRMKVLDEYIAQTMVNDLYMFRGANQYTGGKGTVVGFDTNIAPAFWNPSLFSYLSLVSVKNKFSNPFLLSGTNLYEAAWIAAKNRGNANGSGDAAMFDTFRTYFDVFNIDTELDPEKITFMIDKNAVGFFSKTYYPWTAGDERANKYGGVGGSVGMKYQVESMNLPGVFYDVTYQVVCESNEIKHKFRLDLNAGFFRNPVGCNLNNTGILTFHCE